MDGATVSVAVVASRTEAELIAGMLRSHEVLYVLGAHCVAIPSAGPAAAGTRSSR